MMPPVVISTDRFLLKSLIPDDVGERYLSWLTDQTVSQYISAATLKPSIDSLKQYVQSDVKGKMFCFLAFSKKILGSILEI